MRRADVQRPDERIIISRVGTHDGIGANAMRDGEKPRHECKVKRSGHFMRGKVKDIPHGRTSKREARRTIAARRVSSLREQVGQACKLLIQPREAFMNFLILHARDKLRTAIGIRFIDGMQHARHVIMNARDIVG